MINQNNVELQPKSSELVGETETRTRSEHSLCASQIKKILKKEFPTIKFKVTSKIYSGGDSVYIDWTDGATTDQISKLVEDFQFGHFDGMTDSYEYSNRKNDLPQVKYLHLIREISERFRWAIAEAKGLYRKTGDLGSDEEVQIWRESLKIDWTDEKPIKEEVTQ